MLHSKFVLCILGPVSVVVNVFVTSILGRRLLDEELQRVRELGYLAQVEDEMVFDRELKDASIRDDFIAWLMVFITLFLNGLCGTL